MGFKISDLVEINKRSLSKKDSVTEFKYLDTSNLTEGIVDEVVYYDLNVDKAPSRARRKVKENDILISTVRPNQKHFGIISENQVDYIVSTGFAVLSPKEEKVDPYYLYKYLTSESITAKLQSIAEDSTSAYPSIRPNVIGGLNIELPNLQIQRRVGSFFRNIDSKILLNMDVIYTLEQLTQTLFKRWFVDFEFPNENGEPYKSSGGEMVETELGIIPKGWEIGTIGCLAKVRSGYAFKSAWWSKEGDSVIKIKDIENNTINLSNLSHVSQEKGELAVDFKVVAGDLLIALTGATLGKIGMVPKTDKNLLVNQRVGKFFLGEAPLKNVAFLYSVLLQPGVMDEIVDRGSGSAQPNLSPTNLEKIKIVVPTKPLFQLFNKEMHSIMELLVTKHYENTKLGAIRDTLLPKLLSGEIELPEVGKVGL